MKIVIDLPEEVVKHIEKGSFNPIMYYKDVEQAMGKAEPLSETFEKVSAEIKRMEYHMIDCEVLVSQEDVLDIIEKHKGVSE